MKADEVLDAISNSAAGDAARERRLLVYLGYPRGVGFEQRKDDPFEPFAVMGASFGDDPAHSLQSLARQAMPDRAADIDRLFAEGKPTLDVLDGLQKGISYPQLRAVFGTENVVEIAARVLGDDNEAQKLGNTAGVAAEFVRSSSAELGIGTTDPGELAAWVLLGELAHDLPEGMPEALSGVKVPAETYRAAAARVCEMMRVRRDLCDGYISRASDVESAYRLRSVFGGWEETGSVDTFAFEDELRLGAVARAAAAGDLPRAAASLRGLAASVWREQPDRALQWRVAESAIRLLRRADDVAGEWEGVSTSASAMVLAYTADRGWCELDRAQRAFEQAAANAQPSDTLAPLIDLCRHRYWDLTSDLADRFQELVAAEGWPPQAIERQQLFYQRHIEPLMAAGEKVAWFVVDAMRFEMGRDLAAALVGKADARLEPVAAALPTSTAICMAALMPGADSGWAIRDGVPCIGQRALPDLEKRKTLLAEVVGDRFAPARLSEVRSATKGRLADWKRIGLLMVYTDDLDKLGEAFDADVAHRYRDSVIGGVLAAADRLAGVGFTVAVVTADHGHVLSFELPAGEVQSKPTGAWTIQKRRCLLGKATSAPDGVLVVPGERAGVVGDVEQIAFARGLRSFVAGAAYYHEGLSLPECIVPVVTFRLRAPAAPTKPSVSLSYKTERFTALVFQVTLHNAGLFECAVGIEVVNPNARAPQNAVAGSIGDIAERDEHTGAIRLAGGQQVGVPIVVKDEGAKLVEIRAMDPTTGVLYASLRLKNQVME